MIGGAIMWTQPGVMGGGQASAPDATGKSSRIRGLGFWLIGTENLGSWGCLYLTDGIGVGVYVLDLGCDSTSRVALGFGFRFGLVFGFSVGV